MVKKATADMVIVGGGVAGLWLLHRLRQAGYTAILFESDTLGGGQTHKAQGIIHGGMKYALQGVMTNDAKAMADMPLVWGQCLQGEGEIDLSAVPVLSSQHFLWSPNKLTAKIAGFFAGAALTSKVESLAKEHYPRVFQHKAFKGEIFALNEMVIDVPALVRELAKANREAIYKIEPLSEEALQLNQQGELVSMIVHQAEQSLEVTAQQFIFTAGAGNEIILNKIKSPEVAMQRRPLHMVMVKLPANYPLYAHCFGFGPRPRITVTTHYLQDGSCIWYVGGLIAEEGVERSEEKQIKVMQQELEDLFPWIDFKAAEFASFLIDRAEPKQSNGLKPESSFFKRIANIGIAWPTKLALAPKLAHDVLAHYQSIQLTPQSADVQGLKDWPTPAVTQPIWEKLFCKNVK